MLFRDDPNLELCHGNGLSGARCLLSCSGVGGKEEKESGRLILEPTVSHPAMTATLLWFHGGFQCCKKLSVNKEEQILFSLEMLKDSSVIILQSCVCLASFYFENKIMIQPCTWLAAVILFLMFLVEWLLCLYEGSSWPWDPCVPRFWTNIVIQAFILSGKGILAIILFLKDSFF